MNTKTNNSIASQIAKYLKKMPGNVLLRRELTPLGSYRQVSRVLNALVAEKRLVKIGQGIYAKSYESQYAPVPIIAGGFNKSCQEALVKLGVDFEPGAAVQAYNRGESQQIPMRTVVRLKKRFRGHLGYGAQQVIFENQINAK